MKLATLHDGSRDGRLVVVSRDLSVYADAGEVAPTLQYALDHWDQVESKLAQKFDRLQHKEGIAGRCEAVRFMAPLPRAYEWVDGSAYINHIVLVRKARNALPPETLRTDPLVYQGGSSVMMGHKDDIALANAEWGLDFESEVCVVLGDTPQGTTKQEANKYVRLLMIANDVSLRNLIPVELEKGFGFFNSKPATAFSPVAVTPDELGAAWHDGRVHLPLVTEYNNQKFGDPNAGPEMHFSFFDLIEHICKTRAFTAGTILGSGTVSNEDRSRGSSCLAEKRMIEKIDTGKIVTPFMQTGDTVAIEMRDAQGNSIFGRIAQHVVPFKK